ncbi:MAG: serine hydrolase domain-containing protein [Lysobacteraceae bacterium]
MTERRSFHRIVTAAALTILLLPALGMAARKPDIAAAQQAIIKLSPRVIRDGRVTGLSVALVHGDRVVMAEGYGETRIGSGDRVQPDTVFRIASLSKAFAGTLAAMLVDEGVLSWDDRISEFLPAFRLKSAQAAANVTVEDILSHRVGLPFNTYDRKLEEAVPYPLLVGQLSKVLPLCDPGDCYSYQNIAFSLIGDMVFSVTGDFYSHQVEKRIFHPLDMDTATFGRDALERNDSWARPHVYKSRRWVAVRPNENYYHVPPAAGINASVRDMANWAIAQLGHRKDALPADVLKVTRTPRVQTLDQLGNSAWRRERLRDAHYALGWRIYNYAGEPMVFHAGAVEGYRAMIGILPEQDVALVMLWNCENAVPAGLFATVVDRLLGLPSKDWLQLDKLRARRR